MMWTRLLASAAVAAVVGCAGQPAQQTSAQPAPGPSPTAQTSVAPGGPGASGFDGTYRGTATAAGGGGRYACPPSNDQITTVVRNGTVTGRWNSDRLEAKIQPDGSFRASAGVARMTGRATGNQLEYEIAGQSCKRTYSLSRS